MSQLRRLLRTTMPELTAADHANLAAKFKALSESMEEKHTQLLDQAFLKHFGRARKFWDYKVTCIWRDEFPEDVKEQLRHFGYGASRARTIAHAHACAATAPRTRKLIH